MTDLNVRLQPRSGKDEIVGERDGRIVIRVAAPPVDGRANDALTRLIARKAHIAPARVTIVRGHRARDKTIRVDGVDEQTLRAGLGV